ncbi:MATE family efflux transporter [Anaeromicrobium sediminis]|uniref:Multidrug export protein MepA n=1 Tax=Anaeromicrobium sediminis TaxID=1478221 RepID=A0A267MBY6_9FIRM|nr:MATE family efflux transporter [Anaeromicrobium sediminis]PAB56902.1 hypothetical protein CCE28_20015 [Anaeromicrobium sediminis]
MEDKRMKLMAEEKVSKALIALSLPAIIGMLVNAVYNAVDTMFVGMVGTAAIGAVSLSFPILMLLSTVGLTFGIGGGSYISRALGKREIDNANKAANMALFTTLVLGILSTILGLVFMDKIVNMIGASATIKPYAIEYLRVIILGSVFIMGNMTMNNILRAEGSSKFSMIAMSTGALLNIALDPLLIIKFDMGVGGAAIATVFSQIVTFIMLAGYIFTGKSMLKISIKNLKFDKEIYNDILKIGTPTFVRQLTTTFAMMLMNGIAATFGDSVVAAMGVTNRVIIIGMYVIFGLSQGFQPLAGFNYGAKSYDRLKETIKITIRWASIFTTCVSIVFAIFAEPIIMIFSKDPAVIEVGVTILRALCVLFPFFGFQAVYSSLFQAMGKAKEASILALSRQGIFFVPALLTLPKLFGLNGLIASQPIADFFTIIVTFYFATKIKKELDGLDGISEERLASVY